MQSDLARASLIVGILAFTAFLVWIFHSPVYLWGLCLLILSRKPKTARKAVHERFEDIEHKLEQIAQLITKRPE